MVIPTGIMISGRTPELQGALSAVPHPGRSVGPVFHLLFEMSRAEGTKWQPFLDVLPKDPRGPIGNASADDPLMVGSSTSKVWDYLHGDLRDAYDAVQSTCKNFPGLLGKECPSYQTVKWAMSISWSRTFKLLWLDKRTSNKTDEGLAMAPLADMMDHAPLSAKPLSMISQYAGTGELVSIAMVAERDYEVGDFLHYYYGPECNSQKVAVYGFVETTTGEHDCYYAGFDLLSSGLCQTQVVAVTQYAYETIEGIALRQNQLPTLAVARLFWLLALNSCDKIEVDRIMRVKQGEVSVELDQRARELWHQNLADLENGVSSRIMQGARDTASKDGIMQTLLISERQAIRWHIQSVKTTLDFPTVTRNWHSWDDTAEMAPTCAGDHVKYALRCEAFSKVGGCTAPKTKRFMKVFCCRTCVLAISNSNILQ